MSFLPRMKYGVNSSGPPAHRASGPEGIQIASGPEGKDWIPPYQVRGRLIKSGMTKCVKSFMKHYTSTFSLHPASAVSLLSNSLRSQRTKSPLFCAVRSK